MESSELLNAIKNASNDGENFNFIIGSVNPDFNDATISTAKFLERELYITLKSYKVYDSGANQGVELVGKINKF